jgi:hypothetical protein
MQSCIGVKMPELKHLESREVVAHTTNSQAPLTHRGGQGTKIAPQLKNAHPQGDPNTAQPLEAVPELVDEPVSELPPTLPYWPNPALLQKLLDDNSLLSTEDKELYREMFHAVCFDMQPQSIMQWLLIKDIVDKRFGTALSAHRGGIDRTCQKGVWNFDHGK